MNNYIFPFLWMRGESEETIRNEVEKISACGIGAVCVEARPHPEFCGGGWWHDMDIVIEEAKKRGMKIWILDDKHFPTGYANGLIQTKYPERKKQYISCTTADVFGSRHPLTLHAARMLKPTIGFWEIGNPVNEKERANNRLLGVLAVRFGEGSRFHEDVIDLTDAYDGQYVSFCLPEGQWRIHVIYKTRTDGGNESYINMIDKASAHTQIEGVYEAHYAKYQAEFGKTIAGFFSDEPQFGNITKQCFDTKLGKKKMPLPWSDELEEMLRQKYSGNYRKLLAFLFSETVEMEICPKIRYDYMDCVSALYERNFSRPIGEWCEAHGVEYIGHVVEDNGVHSRLGLGAAHYFRAMAGQHMAGIDVIGGQIVYGAPVQTRKGMVESDGEFFHYALGKMGASCGHLDPKKKGRTMCELFGAYGWGFGVRNMKYLLDHVLVKGINHLVPHAFSMAEYPDFDCPPHFYAGGNHPQFSWFAQLMKYANRMCGLLNGGMHKACAAVLYDAEADWAGEHMPMQKVCRVLTENQIEFDIVCLDMLAQSEHDNGSLQNGKLCINGVKFDALLVPYAKYVSKTLAEFAARAETLPIYWIGAAPKRVLCGIDPQEAAVAKAGWDRAWSESFEMVSLEELADKMKKAGFVSLSLDRPFSQMNVYHYETDRQIFMFQNESAYEPFYGNAVLPLPCGTQMVYYDAYEDVYTDASCACANGQLYLKLELEPGESTVVMEKKEITAAKLHASKREQIQACSVRMDLSAGWYAETAKAKDYPAFEQGQMMDRLHPISDDRPDFSGIIRYTKEIELDSEPEEAYLWIEHVYEVMRVYVNGSMAGECLTPPYQVTVKGLRSGNNTICIETASTPARDQMNYPMPPFDFSHEALEPTGMFGQVILNMRK